MSLDCENTFSLVPYIDLVIEVLEDVLQGIAPNQTPPIEQAPYEQIAAAKFPPSLPFHLPLTELRLYLEQLKLNLQDIYRLFGVIDPALVEELLPLTRRDRTVDPTVLATHLQSIHDLLVAVEPELAREGLGLSPSNFDLIKTAIAPDDLPDYYGTVTLNLAGKGSLEDVDIFTAQVGISRENLNTLLFLDLNPDEVQAGLSRLFFINNTGDQAGHLMIESDVERQRFIIPRQQVAIARTPAVEQIIQDLDRERVSSQVITSLQQAFAAADSDLPDEALTNAKVEAATRGSRWLVHDMTFQRTYIVALEGNELAIEDALYLRLNNHETPPWLFLTFTSNGISLSPDTRVLVDVADGQWRVWDAEQSITYVIRLTENALVVFDEPYDRLANLTPQKLDRLYRFLKLAHHLDWSYGDLDWALRSLQGSHVAEKVLQFDGTNDFVAIANTQDLAPSSFTLEAWVMMAETGTQPILAQGNPDGSRTQFLFWITSPGQLAFFTTALTERDLPNWQDHPKGQLLTRNNQRGLNLTGERPLTPGGFTHVAVTVNEKVAVDAVDYYQLKFYINGVLDSTWSLNDPIPFATAPGEQTINLGKDLLNEYFAG
ncbi:MAG: LamG-like jellyroll fold domain-containing protein, partial [Cyanobacteria bacterium P01_H01_bin.162]